MSSSSIPTLPPLYFQGKNTQPSANESESQSVVSSILLDLPIELSQQCLAGYCDWGTLARLSAVRSSWSEVVDDAANDGGRDARWGLANAMLDGTDGLGRNPARAIEYLRSLAGVTLTDVADENDTESSGDNESEEVNNDDHADDSDSNNEETFFAPAMRKLATCYLTGDGTDKDTALGLRWLEIAYRRGRDIDAAHELAVIYEYGEHGVENDVVAAAEWFKIAAEGGHAEAMSEYALCCELGCGRDQCDDDALEWYVKAAEAGHITAKFSVGEAYEEARGVPQSDEEACLWYYKAAVEGDEDSKRALQRLRDIARIVLPGWEGILAAGGAGNAQ